VGTFVLGGNIVGPSVTEHPVIAARKTENNTMYRLTGKYIIISPAT
jgi:hypothetical protein